MMIDINMLNRREKAIIKRIAQGKTNAKIASEFNLTISQINYIVVKLKLTTHSKNRSELVSWAYENELINS